MWVVKHVKCIHKPNMLPCSYYYFTNDVKCTLLSHFVLIFAVALFGLTPLYLKSYNLVTTVLSATYH